MSMDIQSIIKYSAHCINCISKLRIDLAKRVRTRARQLFEVLAYQGLPYLFAYIGGKSTERGLQTIYDVICRDGDINELASELERKIRELRLSDEDASYALYGASLMCVISKTMGINLKCSLEELIYRHGFDKLVQKISYEVARWLKFFAEAKLPE